jgi:ADP-glucose type glycogen/starch synthase
MIINRKARHKKPTVLVVTPEITYLPPGMGNMANRMTAKAGGLADVSASLVSVLFEMGADIHVTLPHYRQMFHMDVGKLISDELRLYQRKLPQDRIHLAEDRIFYYRDAVYANYQAENAKLALAFQREVINNVIPAVNPDLIHCNDWMTGLIPAVARRRGIPCLFTVHNIHTRELTLATVEDHGIDAAEFWLNLYFADIPGNYEQTRNSVPVDFLTSGIFAAHFINTVSPTFLEEIVTGQHDIPEATRRELSHKYAAGCASGILNAPDVSYDPEVDPYIAHNFTPDTHAELKASNKVEFQRRTGLTVDPDAPLFFWPSRFDPVQKGCQLLAEILYKVVDAYWDDGLQIALVSNGPYESAFRDIVRHHDIPQRVAVCDFREELSRQGYAASDYILMPSKFEPCGLPQMIGPIYGSLPLVNDTGGLHDTVTDLNPEAGTGNGFLFNIYDSTGLNWAFDQAMAFQRLGQRVREREIRRIMVESRTNFSHAVTAGHYIELYERMLHRPLLKERK